MNTLFLIDTDSVFSKWWYEFVDWKTIGINPLFMSVNSSMKISELNNTYFEKITKFTNYIRLYLNLPSIIDEFDIELVHAHYLSYYGIMTALTRKNVKKILTIWGSDVYETHFPSIPFRYIFSNFDKIHAQSKYSLDVYTEKYLPNQNKLYQKHWGIHPVYKNQSPVSILRKEFPMLLERNVIFSPRYLDPLYNSKPIYQAFRKINSGLDDFILVLLTYGRNTKYIKKLKERITLDGESDNVLIIDRMLKPIEMKELYQLSDITVHVPISDQLALSVLETISQPTIPLLINNINYLEYLKPEQNAIYVDNVEIGTLVDAIQEIYLHYENYQSIIENNKRLISHFGFMDENLNEIIENLYFH